MGPSTMRFTETRAPTQSEIAEVTRRVQARVLRELKRRGMLRDPNDARNQAEDEPIIGCAQLSLRLGKLARVDAHGRVQPADMDLDARFASRLDLATSANGRLTCERRSVFLSAYRHKILVMGTPDAIKRVVE